MSNADPAKQRDDLLADVRRSVRYHMRRCAFFDGLSTFFNALGVFSGSGAVVALVSKLDSKWLAGTLAAIVAAGATINIVVGTSKRARLHNDLARRFIDLERQIELAGQLAEDGIRGFTAQRLHIEADEPPIMRILDTLCHNEMATAMGCGKTQIRKVGFFRRALAHFVNLDCTNLRTVAEIEDKKAAKRRKRIGPEPSPAK